MHLFFDTVWKLHIGEIPEKPMPVEDWETKGGLQINVGGDFGYSKAIEKYNEAIAAIKQNALTVGNPEVIKSKLDSLEWVGRIDKADVYKWPGGYETLKNLHCDEYHQHTKNSCFTTVAILTLPEEHVLTKESISSMKLKPVPEEKKNTMENMTKEQQFNLPPAAVFNLQQIALADDDMVKAPGAAEKYRFIARHILELFAASGSVAAPKEDAEIIEELEAKGVRSLLRENTALREALKELLLVADMYLNSKVLEYARGNFEKSDLEDSAAIIDRARKLISK